LTAARSVMRFPGTHRLTAVGFLPRQTVITEQTHKPVIEHIYRKTRKQQASQRRQQTVWSSLLRSDPLAQRRTLRPKHQQLVAHFQE